MSDWSGEKIMGCLFSPQNQLTLRTTPSPSAKSGPINYFCPTNALSGEHIEHSILQMEHSILRMEHMPFR